MMTIKSPQTKLVSSKAQALKRTALVASVSVAALLTGCATTTATGKKKEKEKEGKKVF